MMMDISEGSRETAAVRDVRVFGLYREFFKRMNYRDTVLVARMLDLPMIDTLRALADDQDFSGVLAGNFFLMPPNYFVTAMWNIHDKRCYGGYRESADGPIDMIAIIGWEDIFKGIDDKHLELDTEIPRSTAEIIDFILNVSTTPLAIYHRLRALKVCGLADKTKLPYEIGVSGDSLRIGCSMGVLEFQLDKYRVVLGGHTTAYLSELIGEMYITNPENLTRYDMVKIIQALNPPEPVIEASDASTS